MSDSSHDETIRFRIPGDLKYVPAVRRAIRSVAHSLGCTESAAEDIELSVAEAVTNAVEHGSPAHKKNAVVVICKIDGNRLTIDVKDEGPGFNLPESKENCESLDERGRGLTLIYVLMDTVKICRTPRGSRIRMVKNCDSPSKECQSAPR